MVDIRKSIEAKSDRLNADDLIGGPITVKIEDVRAGKPENPVAIFYEGCNGKPWYPCKSMRRAMVYAWTDDGKSWVGKSVTLYRDPDVAYGGVKVGGIRISHMSHIDSDMTVALTKTRGKKEQFTFKRLVEMVGQQGAETLKQVSDATGSGMVADENTPAASAMKAMNEAKTLDRLTAITGSKKYAALVDELNKTAPDIHAQVIDCARKNAERLNEEF